MKKIGLLSLLALIISGSVYFGSIYKKPEKSQSPNQAGQSGTPITLPADETAKYTIDNQESIYYIINKNRPLPLTYIPPDLTKPDIPLIPGDRPEEQQLRGEAAAAAEQLFESAAKAGHKLVMASGYRSATLQKFYYDNYVKRDGQAAADKYSARPGASEHQTGLALDITRADRKCYLETCFGSTPEGQWLAENAHRYGFILRYPEDKADITGYSFEPWHFRYVGTDLAAALHDSNQTMEEFFDL